MPTIVHACLSDRGLTHPGNEDRWYADPSSGIYLVSDGMAYAEPAQLVVDHLPNLLRQHLADVLTLKEEVAAAAVRSAIREVSELVRAAAQAEPDGAIWQGLGATIVLAVVRDSLALLAHLGDSRIYRMRAAQLDALTCDHSHLEELVRTGKLTREEMKHYTFNGGPTRFAGMTQEARADTCLLDFQIGDRLLLCSDGLTCMLDDEAIERVMNDHPDPVEACGALIAAANAAGGVDNITALVLTLVID